MGQPAPSLDMRVLSERIAEAVNKQLAKLDDRIKAIEGKVRLLEAELGAVKSTTLDAVIRSVLSFKAEEMINEATAKITSAVAELRDSASTLQSSLQALIDSMNKLITAVQEAQQAREKGGEKVQVVLKSDVIRRAVGEATADIRRSVDSITATISELKQALTPLAELGKSIGEASKELSQIASDWPIIKGQLSYVYERVKEAYERPGRSRGGQSQSEGG